MSKVALEGMQFFAYHGFYEEERLMGTYFVVDVYVDTNFMMAASTDDLGGTVNYETIYFVCRVEMKKTSKLIETVAQRIHNKLSGLFTSASGITVRISKLNPPLGGLVERSFVEVGGGSSGSGMGGGLGSFGEDDDEDPFGGMPGGFGGLGGLW
ncbi:MAG: dihydroneopterin aldolase [Bacteroidota bacterium]